MAENIKITQTFNLDSKGTFKGDANHVLRRNEHYKNDTIDLAKSHYNAHFVGPDLGVKSLDELLSDQYDDYIADHDAKCAKRHHNKDMFHDLDGYAQHVKSMKGQNPHLTTRGIITIGDKTSKDDLLNRLKKSKPGVSDDQLMTDYSDVINQFFQVYISSYNKSFPSYPITEAVIHQDEGGAPHAHVEMVPLGHTGKRNKPTNTINAAVKDCLDRVGVSGKNNQDRLSKWRHLTDDAMVRLLNDDRLSKMFQSRGYPVDSWHFKLLRTGAQGGNSMETYKSQQKLKSRETALNDREYHLNVRESSVNVQSSEVANEALSASSALLQAQSQSLMASQAMSSAQSLAKSVESQAQSLSSAQSSLAQSVSSANQLLSIRESSANAIISNANMFIGVKLQSMADNANKVKSMANHELDYNQRDQLKHISSDAKGVSSGATGLLAQLKSATAGIAPSSSSVYYDDGVDLFAKSLNSAVNSVDFSLFPSSSSSNNDKDKDR